MNSKNRIEFIDLAKGFCILLVLVNHVFGDMSSSWMSFCGLFRMPLYFFLSGLFFKSYGGFINFIRKKSLKLLLPFSLFYLIVDIPSIFLLQYLQTKHIEPSLMLFWGSYGRIKLGITAANWFLLCLLEVNVLFYFIQSICKNKILPVLIFSSVVGFVGYMCNYFHIYLAIWLDTSMTALPFFALGYFIKNKQIILFGKFSKGNALLLVFTLVAFFIIMKNHVSTYEIFYVENTYNESVILLYGGGVLGITLVLLVSKLLKKIPIISYVGRYSIVVLTTHMIYIFIIRNVLFQFRVNQNSVILNWVIVLIIILLSIPTIFYGIRYLPLLFAQDRDKCR